MATWLESQGTHTLEDGDRIIATIRPAGLKRKRNAVRFELHLDPLVGTQRANETLKLTGLILGGLKTAKRVIAFARLARFGFAQFLPEVEDSQPKPKPPAPPKKAAAKTPAPKRKAPAKKRATTKKKA